MKLYVFSDIHGDLSFLEAASEEMAAADLIIFAGDLSQRGSAKEAEKIIKTTEKINKNIAAVHGNWDKKEVCDMLEERGYSLHGRGMAIGSTGFFGVGGSSPTPMNTPTEYSEEELLQFLEKGYSQIASTEKKIMVSHTPPRKTRDRTFLGIRGGSHSVRKFAETNRIDLCLCGHIHEAAGTFQLGNCIVANPGSFKKGRYMTVEINSTITVERSKYK